MPNLVILILQIAVIIVAARVMGILFRAMKQPPVVGEMAAGILLGPSLLGWAAPGVSAYLFPPSSLGYLSALSQVGLVIFMFLVGLSLKPDELKEQGHSAVLTSHVSITAPFALAALLALYLYPRLSDDSVTFTGFALFLGAAMSITAFPVLARILKDQNMLHTRLGTVSLVCAAVDDVTGWCVLAYIVALVRANHSTTPLWVTLVGSVAFGLIMIYGVRRLLTHFGSAFQRKGRLSENAIALMVLVVLCSALTTEYLGIHLLFGAFMVGTIMPKEPKFIAYVNEKFESLTVVLLLPLFFAITGLRMSLGSIKGTEMWMYCGIIILVAVAGKLGGSMIAAKAAGMDWRDAAGLGILMNTRGLMQLVILNIGLDIKVISPALFSLMVVMALVTTFMTTPLLEMVYPSRLIKTEPERAVTTNVA